LMNGLGESFGLLYDDTIDRLQFATVEGAGLYSFDNSVNLLVYQKLALKVNMSAKTVELYVNGIKNGNTLDVSATPPAVAAATHVTLGDYNMGGLGLSGNFTYFSLHNKDLSTDELNAWVADPWLLVRERTMYPRVSAGVPTISDPNSTYPALPVNRKTPIARRY